jgi:hypothetical protein
MHANFWWETVLGFGFHLLILAQEPVIGNRYAFAHVQ